MSIHIMAFARSKAYLPKASAWAAAIREAGFALQLNVDFDPRTQEGFLPSSYDGKPAGFEYYCEPMEEYLSEVGDEFSPSQLKRLNPFGIAVDFVSHSRFADGLAAAIAAGVLVSLTRGLLLDTNTGEFHDGASSIPWARTQEREYLPHLHRDEV